MKIVANNKLNLSIKKMLMLIRKKGSKTKKVLLLVQNIREKCSYRINSNTVLIKIKKYCLKDKYNYNYRLKYTICKDIKIHIYAELPRSTDDPKGSQRLLKASDNTLLGVF